MTLLITAAGRGYTISSSDTRISIASGGTHIPVNERFNKHITFCSAGFRGNITFTGIAEWQEAGETIRLYDLISDSIKESAQMSLSLGSLSWKLAAEVLHRLWLRKVPNPKKEAVFEFHIAGWYEEMPYPVMCVVSTFRNVRPWFTHNDFEVEKHYEGFHFYMKSVDEAEVIFGGASACVSKHQRERLFNALAFGANGFQASQLMSKIIARASVLSKSVGPRSVAVTIPQVGSPDTNVWDRRDDTILGFIPLIIYPNGATMGPSEFPVNLNLMLDGKLPPHSLFFKTIISKHFKLSDRRRAFRLGRGKFVPGLYDILSLVLFGAVPDGYTDFGLGEESNNAGSQQREAPEQTNNTQEIEHSE